MNLCELHGTLRCKECVYVDQLIEEINELISLNLWSARRLPKIYKQFAYDELDTITGNLHERL